MITLNLLLSSCIPEPEAPKIEITEINQLAKVKTWFEENKTKLRLPEQGSNYRTESQELILPFFEKEPDWNKFHHYYFPDGREVFEVSLENATKYFPASMLDSFPNQNPANFVVQNIIFIKHPTEDRFDPLIARYFPNDEYSIGKMKNISFNRLNQYWSGQIDIFTYDEHHFIGFQINEGQIAQTNRFGTPGNLSSRVLSDCRQITREVVWTSSSPGPADDDPLGLGVTLHSITIVEVICSGSMDNNPPPGAINIDGEFYYEFANGNEGCTDCDYNVPIINNPTTTILNHLSNPCASSILKNVLKTSKLRSSIGQLNQMNEIIDLLDNANGFEFIIKNSNISNSTDRDIKFNIYTGKNEVTINLNNNYLETATKLSIARTILHEIVHAYLLYVGCAPLEEGVIQNGLMNYALTVGLDLGDIHHNFMAQYVDAIGYSLEQWHLANGGASNIPSSYFKEIAWGGLSAKSFNSSNNQYVWFESYKVLVPSESERIRIHNNIINEYVNNSDAKTDPC
ncbi:hypothetical protein Ataiwa_22770 [Algoriphagus taiwanensis]|uniref:SprT-like domain-containing protein n=1 Tax=Algoriphagus taiwanensis TaxID=1445656 RepID=A0ABQ6Q302_9BACT|nr:hypothetical protein Ataiwa_22770 [Algoriphagus taiwanensis]